MSAVPADLLTVDALDAGQILGLYGLAERMRADPGAYASTLRGLSVIMLFEKPSLRTRTSFQIGVQRMGASCMYFDHDGQRIGERESVHDYARNLERFVDCIVARVYEHRVLEELAEHARVPVVNALSDQAHPCQALADYLTIMRHASSVRAFASGGAAEGFAHTRVAWIGDGNNVCHSLMLAGARLGARVTVITPPGYGPRASVIERCAAIARERSGPPPVVTTDPDHVAGHHVVYTDTWVSMGQGEEAADRRGRFRGYTVTSEVMERAAGGLGGGMPIFMHCLPAHRGEEVTAEVIDGPWSVVFDQAENRMWAQNALLAMLLGRAG